MIKIKFFSDTTEREKGGLYEYFLTEYARLSQQFIEENDGTALWVAFFVLNEKELLFWQRQKKKLNDKGIRVSFESCCEDWQEKWKENMRPFYISDDIYIEPVWSRSNKKLPKECIRIRLDVHKSFGIGTHATTRMIAGFLLLKKRRFENFFDIGCGTGLLTVLAGILGAGEVCAIDTDSNAIKETKKNVCINNINGACVHRRDFAKLRFRRCYDFIAANMHTDFLVHYQEKIVRFSNPGGYIALSGIMEENYKFFKKNFKTKALRCLRVIKEDGWMALLYKKIV